MTNQLAPVIGWVVVIEGRPRYHLEDCRCVADKDGAAEVEVKEALSEGYTPCGLCKPDAALATLAAGAPARSAAAPVIPVQATDLEAFRPPGPRPPLPAPRRASTMPVAVRVAPSPPAPLPSQPLALRRKGSGLAITGLVLGAVGVLLCWIPIVNNVAFGLGVLGLVFAIPAAISARRGRREGGGMANAAVILSILSIVATLAFQALFVKAIDDAFDGVAQDSATSSSGLLSDDQDVSGRTAETPAVAEPTAVAKAPAVAKPTVVAKAPVVAKPTTAAPALQSKPNDGGLVVASASFREQAFTGSFQGTARITNSTGDADSAAVTFTLFKNGKQVATLIGVLSDIEAGRTQTVQLMSTDPFVAGRLTYDFQRDF